MTADRYCVALRRTCQLFLEQVLQCLGRVLLLNICTAEIGIPTADKILSVGQQRCSVERSVSAVEIFQNDSLSWVQVSFCVLRLTSDTQRSRHQLRRLQRQQLEYSNGPGD